MRTRDSGNDPNFLTTLKKPSTNETKQEEKERKAKERQKKRDEDKIKREEQKKKQTEEKERHQQELRDKEDAKTQGKEIVTGLFLGNRHVAANKDWFEENNCKFVLNVTKEVNNYFAVSCVSPPFFLLSPSFPPFSPL